MLAMSPVTNLVRSLLGWLLLFCMPVKHRHEVQTGEYLIGLAILIVVVTLVKLCAIFLMHGWARGRLIRFVCQLFDCLFWWTLREALDYKVFTFPDVVPIIGLALNYCLIRMMVTAELDVAPESVHAPEATPEPSEKAQEAPSGEDLLQSRLASLHRPHKVAGVSAPLLTFSSRIDANRPQSPPKISSLQRLSSHDFKIATREFMHLVRPVIYILLFCSYIRLHYSPVALDNAYECINNIQDDTISQTLRSAKSCLVPLFSKECPGIGQEECEEICEERLGGRDRPQHVKGACRIEMTGLKGIEFWWPESFDPYSTLNVTIDTPQKGIRKAYHDAVRQWHPDKRATGMSKEALTCITEHINRAYETLGGTGIRSWRDGRASRWRSGA